MTTVRWWAASPNEDRYSMVLIPLSGWIPPGGHFQWFGERGIGRQAAPFRVIGVERLQPGRAPVVVCNGVDLTIATEKDHAATGEEIARSWMIPGVSRATLRFLTPVRFKASGRFVANAPSFSVLIGRLLDRLEGISLLKC